MDMKDKVLLEKRSLAETVIGLLKNISDLWHTRHRSVENGTNNMFAAMAAYSLIDRKPDITDRHKRGIVLSLVNTSN